MLMVRAPLASSPRPSRPPGLRAIIAYKLIKAPLLLLLALYLTLAEPGAYRAGLALLSDLADRGGLWLAIADEIAPRFSDRVLPGIRLLAWGDGLLTLLEGLLLYQGKRWGEWVVALGLTALLPIELYALLVHRQWGRLVVLLVNFAVVFYLLRRLIGRRGEHRG